MTTNAKMSTENRAPLKLIENPKTHKDRENNRLYYRQKGFSRSELAMAEKNERSAKALLAVMAKRSRGDLGHSVAGAHCVGPKKKRLIPPKKLLFDDEPTEVDLDNWDAPQKTFEAIAPAVADADADAVASDPAVEAEALVTPPVSTCPSKAVEVVLAVATPTQIKIDLGINTANLDNWEQIDEDFR